MTDSLAGLSEVGVKCLCNVHAWDDMPRDDFLIYDYFIINNSGGMLTDVYTGFHIDGDISAAAGGSGTLAFYRDDMMDYYLGTDINGNPESISYIYDHDNPDITGNDIGGIFSPKESLGYLGSRVLDCPISKNGVPANQQSGHQWWDWNSDPGTGADWYNLMALEQFKVSPVSPHDYRYFQTLGPWDIVDGDSIHISLAFGIGNGLSGLRQNLQHAYDFYWYGTVPNVFMVTNTNDNGTGSLRQAIIDANAQTGTDIIAFDIPGTGPHTIQPASGFPIIADPVVIDGTTAPDFGGTPIVELDVTNAGVDVSGLGFHASNNIVRGLVINRFSDNGIILVTSDNNLIEGNFVGTDVTGTDTLGNGNAGVLLENSPDNIIGGYTILERNIISGNLEGVTMVGSGSTNNHEIGNYIGTDLTGASSLGNGTGVLLFASNNIIGGTSNSEQNLISGNTDNGIKIETSDGEIAENNLILGNFIGTDYTGTQAVGNGFGISIAASYNTIGGTVAGAGNLISGNTDDGVWIAAADSPATGNFVQGNYIGSDVTGTLSLGNAWGVWIEDQYGNTIGGLTPEASNVISGNTNGGVAIEGSNAFNNQVQGNFIGTQPDGISPLGNGSNTGVQIAADAHDNTVGGLGVTPGLNDGPCNIIAYNGLTGPGYHDGVRVSSGINNAILGNSIFSNAQMGIDIGPYDPTPNDPGDGDTGANNLQNYPELLSTGIDGNGDLMIEYFVDSDTSNAAYPMTIQFFLSDTSGQGKLFIGEDSYSASDYFSSGATTNLGNAAGLGITFGDSIVSTTTDNEGNTSEFSAIDTVGSVTGITELNNHLPKVYSLKQNYPNPFNPNTTIEFGLPKTEFVTLKVYNILGQEVATLVSDKFTPGVYKYDWDASGFAGGVYMYKIEAASFVQTRKLILMK